MKKFKKIIALLLALVLCSVALVSCVDEPKKEKEDGGLTSKLKGVARGESVALSEDLVLLDQSFIPAEKEGGYVSTAKIDVKIFGYDTDYTYFNGTVTITWTYNEISETSPSGIDKTFSTTIALNADGDGEYSNQISFQGCRDVKLLSVDYEFDGTATKK